MTTLEKILIGMGVALVVAVVGMRNWSRLTNLVTPRPAARSMNLEVAHAQFVVEIVSYDGVWYDTCRAIIDRHYVSAAFRLVGANSKQTYSQRAVKIHLSDFSRGGERYDWQRRSPTHFEVECERYGQPPEFPRMSGLTVEEITRQTDEALQEWEKKWISQPSRWVGQPRER